MTMPMSAQVTPLNSISDACRRVVPEAGGGVGEARVMGGSGTIGGTTGAGQGAGCAIIRAAAPTLRPSPFSQRTT
ncbi:hypothetical protein AVXHC19_30320 [Acidovorax sacchari]